MSASVAAGTGGLAVLLALIGIYGALAYAVSRRRREIGVRLALGAAPAAVARTVVRDALTVTGIGLVLGMPAAALTGRSLRTLVYGVSEHDLATFAATALFFVAVGAAAALVPARRAAGVDPMIALRAE
jgi:putative ABC transport system permease protein